LGASGFLLKTAAASEIVDAIVEIAAGGLAFTPSQLRSARSAAWAPLTQREHRVLEGVLRGRSNDELAGDLGLSRKTIEAHLSRLFARYGVMTRTELAVYVQESAILDLPMAPERTSHPSKRP
jgi:DNA-binding NarL/FixJ family response regulator